MTLAQAHIKLAGSTFHAGVLRGFVKAAEAYGVDPSYLIKLAQTAQLPVANQVTPPLETMSRNDWGPKIPKPAVPSAPKPVARPKIEPRNLQVQSGYHQPDHEFRMHLDPNSRMLGAYEPMDHSVAPPSTAGKPYVNVQVPQLRKGLKVNLGHVNEQQVNANKRQADIRAAYMQKQLQIAKDYHKLSGSSEEFDPKKHFSLYDFTKQYEADTMPYSSFTRDIERGGRIAMARGDQGLRNLIRKVPGLWGDQVVPPEAGLSDEVKKRWLGGGSEKSLYNPMSYAYQRLWKPSSDVLVPKIEADTGSGGVDVQDAAGRSHVIRNVPFAGKPGARYNKTTGEVDLDPKPDVYSMAPIAPPQLGFQANPHIPYPYT